MGLFLAQTVGTNNFQFAKAQMHIISIAKTDTKIGFSSTVTNLQGVNCARVTYAPSLTGPTITRLNAFVNNVGYASPPHVVALAVPAGTMFSGGSLNGVLVSAVAGASFRVGDAGSPMSNHICAVYDADDCDGTGHWVDKDGGGTTSFPPDVILYHELSHCFHFATAAPDSEPLAETDENDMRDVRGLPHRNIASHNGGCGSGPTTCCVVASLATGSSYSEEIQRFRHLREHTLRRSIVGDDLFNEFHHRYYGFSPEVTRLIGHQPNLRPIIRDRFVMPLLAGVEMLICYADHKGKGLASLLRAQASRKDLSAVYQGSSLEELAGYIKVVRNFDNEMISRALNRKGRKYSGLKKLLRHINVETLRDEYIDWLLVAVVELWVGSARILDSGRSNAEIDLEIYEKIIQWIALMPISGVWKELSRLETETELQGLEQFIFDPRSKEIFSERLIEKHPQHGKTIRRWAERRGT